MSKRIFKYKINVGLLTKMEVPNNFNPIHVGLDPSGVPCIWMEVGENKPLCEIGVLVLGTGGTTREGYCYVGSFVQDTWMWHVYIKRV